MYKISGIVTVKNHAVLERKIFINEQLDPIVNTSFYCNNCNCRNHITIVPYKTGFSFLDLYANNEFLNENEISRNRMATKTSKSALRFGNYTVSNLPTLYFGTKCIECGREYLVVFSYGEKQPGLEICEISGVWEIEHN